VCGYFFKPDQHTGDLQAMLDLLMKTGVRVYKLDTPVAVNGYHQYGNSTAGGTPNSVDGQTLPAGTLWIPMNQGMKHWIQALLGENPFTIRWQLLTNALLQPATITDEARRRNRMVASQIERERLRASAIDQAAFRESLNIECQIERATAEDVDRVHELVSRTNQFNTTTRRYTRQQLQVFLASPSHRVHVATLADRFGSLGLVAVVIVEREGEDAVIDSFVMSCRAMGFQFEQAVVRLAIDAEPGVTRWSGLFVPTDRNTPAAGLFAECGFTAGASHAWVRPADSSDPIIPSWFTITNA